MTELQGGLYKVDFLFPTNEKVAMKLFNGPLESGMVVGRSALPLLLKQTCVSITRERKMQFTGFMGGFFAGLHRRQE